MKVMLTGAALLHVVVHADFTGEVDDCWRTKGADVTWVCIRCVTLQTNTRAARHDSLSGDNELWQACQLHSHTSSVAHGDGLNTKELDRAL